MSIRNLPAAPEGDARPNVKCDLSPKAMERWNPMLKASVSEQENVISIYDPIGWDFFGDGVTSKNIASALQSMQGQDVVVNINSPGGDVFEGLAIYNLLNSHNGKVTVRIMGLAASAASFIAMAGDEIQIARAGFLMIHNAWVVAIGNRNDLRDQANWIEQFDNTIADIYQARTGGDLSQIQQDMDNELWIGGNDAVNSGWADSLLPADQVEQDSAQNRSDRIAAHQIDTVLAKAGIPRSQRRSLIQDLKAGTSSAISNGTHDAADSMAINADTYAEVKASLSRTLKKLETLSAVNAS